MCEITSERDGFSNAKQANELSPVSLVENSKVEKSASGLFYFWHTRTTALCISNLKKASKLNATFLAVIFRTTYDRLSIDVNMEKLLLVLNQNLLYYGKIIDNINGDHEEYL